MGDNSSSVPASRWTYVELEIIDADRRLRPTHVCATEIRFSEPPRLASRQITITTRNGDRETTHHARVLAHEADAEHIPIELIQTAVTSKTSTKLTA